MTSPAPPESPPLPRRRRWFRVSLRGLMLLVVVVAVPAAWVVNTIRTQRRAIEVVRAAGGHITFDYERQQVGVYPLGGFVYRKEPAAPRWLRRWLGDELFQSVLEVDYHRLSVPEALAPLAAFDRLEVVYLSRTHDVDVGFRHLQSSRRLKHVRIEGPAATDAALKELAQIRSIEELWIEEAPATAAGLAHLADLTDLRNVTFLDCPGLTDAGAARLVAGWPRLHTLMLMKCPRLATTILALGRHAPNLKVLNLSRAGVTDDDLQAVAGLGRLAGLQVEDATITDASLVALARLTGLTSLILEDCPNLTDAGLVHLQTLQSLKILDLTGSLVTPAGIAVLQRAVPTLRHVNRKSPTIVSPGPVVSPSPP